MGTHTISISWYLLKTKGTKKCSFDRIGIKYKTFICVKSKMTMLRIHVKITMRLNLHAENEKILNEVYFCKSMSKTIAEETVTSLINLCIGVK